MKKMILLTFLSAISVFAADCLSEADDVAVGVCYEQEGKPNLAEAAYERALFEEDTNTEAHLKLAALYRSMGMKNEADEQLQGINDSQLTPQQRVTLASVRTAPKREAGKFRARVELDLGYDDNINISPIVDPITFNDEPNLATRYVRIKADLSYQYNFSPSNGWFLRSDANLYHQYNLDVEADQTLFPPRSSHYYDALFGRLYAGGGYSTDNLSIYVPLFYDRINYLDVDLYHQAGLRPDFNIMFNDMFVLNVNGMYSQRKYEQTIDEIRDDDILALGSGFFWLYGKNMAYVKVRYEDYTAADQDALDASFLKVFVNKNVLSTGIGGIYSFVDILDLRMDLQYQKSNYKEIWAIKRDDTNIDIKLAVERDLFKALRARVQVHSVKNTSNYNQAKYSKHEILVGLVYTY